MQGIALSVPDRRSRLLAGLAAVVGVLLVLTTPGVADAATTRNRADAGAGWVGRQLNDDNVISGQFGASYGATADVVLALSAAGVGKGKARGATRALKAHVLDYTGTGKATEFYAGSFAKLLVVAAARRTNPRAFGTSDRANLVAQLRALECGGRRTCDPADRGRFSDISEFGDYSNTITQSLALIGLERTLAIGPSRPAVQFLVGQQCDNGAFPLLFHASTCTGSVDATGYAVQALVAAGGPAARDAAADAGRWLARHQNRNGSFTDEGKRNANSTALAAQAFDALDRTTRAKKARHFVRSLQAACDAKKSLRGSIRFSRADEGDRVIATSQSVPALAQVTLDEVTKDGSVRGLPRLAC